MSKFTPEQVRRTAKALFMEEWANDPVEASVKAIEFLDDCLIERLIEPSQRSENQLPITNQLNSDSTPIQYAKLMEELTDIVTSKKVHITAAAKGIGVHPVTLRSWIQRDSTPRPDKLAALQSFLAKLNL
jgi:hypothetical protein